MKATIAYKLTDSQGRTRNKGWIHVYSHPLLAVLLNPIHGNFESPRLWRCEVSGKSQHDRGLKSGYTNVKTVEELPLPVVTDAQRVAFAILCAKEVTTSPEWNKWADDWLSGKDRSQEAAWAAWWAARKAAWTAAAVAAVAAVEAARAARAAWAAEDAAAARAAWAAEDAAAAAVAASTKPLDLEAIAERAVREF